jgi:ribosomal protein S6
MNEDRKSVYEIGYLIAPSVPEEKVPAEADALRKILTDAGASIITEEIPSTMDLAYEMRRKTVSGAYDKYNEAYFGWIKFEVGSDMIEAAKKSFEAYPSVLRMLLIVTVRENTYLGKRASVIAADINSKKDSSSDEKSPKASGADKDAAPVSVEDMDKSIDAMVKEA